MPDRRGSRFVLEVLFLLGLAGALTLAKLNPLEIAGVMLVGWVIVAALEWAAWRDEPHFGSGLPPRYYVPRLNLPPPQPLEQVPAGYPEASRDEAPTWIASPALRAEVLGEWPIAAPAHDEPEPADDPWNVRELPAAPLGELDPRTDEVAVLELEEAAPDPAPEPAPSLDVELARSAQGVSRYSLDPLGDLPPKRRFGRGSAELPTGVDVPARPHGIRALPGRTNSQD